MRGRPRDYNAVARNRDLLQDSIDLAVPKIQAAMDMVNAGAPNWQLMDQLRRAHHDLTVGTE